MKYPIFEHIKSIPPDDSPWGEIQHCTEIAPGVFEVDTAGHGGVMLRHETANRLLSPGARKQGDDYREYLCYEEDCDAAIVFRELLDDPGWQLPKNRIGRYTRESFEQIINQTLIGWNPGYVKYRERLGGSRKINDKDQKCIF